MAVAVKMIMGPKMITRPDSSSDQGRPPLGEGLLTVAEAASLIRISKQGAYRLAREGKLPVVRLGRNLRVDPAVLRGWIEGGGRR